MLNPLQTLYIENTHIYISRVLARSANQLRPFAKSLHHATNCNKEFTRIAYTVYGKTFEGENFRGFRGFLANRESFPLESFAVYSA